MKTLFDFAFIPKATPQTVFYHVKVGTSERERRAHQQVIRILAGDSRFLYIKHTPDAQSYLDALALLAAPSRNMPAGLLFEWRTLSVEELLRQLRTMPAAFFNRPQPLTRHLMLPLFCLNRIPYTAMQTRGARPRIR